MVGNCLRDQVPVRFLYGGTVVKEVKSLFDTICPSIQLGLDFAPFGVAHLRPDVRPKLLSQRISLPAEERCARSYEIANPLRAELLCNFCFEAGEKCWTGTHEFTKV